MTANYDFQHNILRNAFELLPNRELKSIIITQDKTRAKELFYDAMKKSPLNMFMNLYEFKCDFMVKNNLPILVYYFDDSGITGPKIISECFAAVIVATTQNHYYTIEYSFENQFVIGQSKNGTHHNYGFYPNNDMETIINSITNLHKNDTHLTTDISQKIPLTQSASINYIKKLQKAILIVFSVFLVLLITFPTISLIVKEERTPSNSYATRLTSLDASQKVYYVFKNNQHYLYVKKDGEIILYKFDNKSMYYNEAEKKGCQVARVTNLQLKEYFGSNLVSGTPSLSYVAPMLPPIMIVTNSILIISLAFMFINLHKRAQAVLFTLCRQNQLFIKNKQAFDNEIISKYEYNQIQKNLLSQKILKNNKLFDLFKYLY